VQRYRRTDGETDGQTDDIMMPIADYTEQQHYRLKVETRCLSSTYWWTWVSDSEEGNVMPRDN